MLVGDWRYAELSPDIRCDDFHHDYISFLLTITISTWTLMTLCMPKYHQKTKKGLFEERPRRSETCHDRRPQNQPVPDHGMPRLPSVLPPSTSCCRSVSRGGRVAVTRDRAEQRIATWGGKLYYYNIANAWDYTFSGYMLKFTVE